ncbi:MAG: DUF4168 domain-containing protein [Leptolyngbyaceae cyanobacterium T60_A2020_046]|nr:DUF4168 domain-containing protein [Leptolyngbyaceae cyanobacterium T60_A2020_046]
MTEVLIPSPSPAQVRRFSRFKQFLSLGLASGILTIAGGSVNPASPIGLSVMPAAIAQTTITAAEISQYARAVLQMDAYRSAAYTQIKDLLMSVNMDISEVDMSCSNTRNLSRVPRRVRRDVEAALTEYCNRARDIVEANGLTPRRFNEITIAHRDDSALADRIQQELLRLQVAN